MHKATPYSIHGTITLMFPMSQWMFSVADWQVGIHSSAQDELSGG